MTAPEPEVLAQDCEYAETVPAPPCVMREAYRTLATRCAAAEAAAFQSECNLRLAEAMAALHRADLTAARAQVDAWREREAACCPEDVGFVEYIAALTKQLTAARAQVAALKADAERFRFVALDLFADGMTVGGVEVVEEAVGEAMAHGREEPTEDDYVMAARIAVDAARLITESPPCALPTPTPQPEQE
jgi:hypothetical protein